MKKQITIKVIFTLFYLTSHASYSCNNKLINDSLFLNSKDSTLNIVKDYFQVFYKIDPKNLTSDFVLNSDEHYYVFNLFTKINDIYKLVPFYKTKELAFFADEQHDADPKITMYLETTDNYKYIYIWETFLFSRCSLRKDTFILIDSMNYRDSNTLKFNLDSFRSDIKGYQPYSGCCDPKYYMYYFDGSFRYYTSWEGGSYKRSVPRIIGNIFKRKINY